MDITKLKEEFATLHTQAGEVLTKASTEKRELSADEKEQNKNRFARMDAITAQVEDAKRLAAYSFQNGDAQLPTEPKGKQEFDAERDGKKLTLDLDKYKSAVNLFARTGDLSKCQQFAITSATASGAYLPKEVAAPYNVRRLPNAVRQLLSLYGVPPITRQFTESISIPVTDDTAVVGQAQTESATSGTAADPDSSGSLTLSPTLYSSKQLWLSNTTVNATDFDYFSYANPMLQKRIQAVQESAWITALQAGPSGKTTTSQTTFTYAEWIAFEHSLAAAYRTDAGFIISDGAYQILRSLVDDQHRPIMDLDPTNQFQATVHGKPVLVSNYMSAPTAGNVVCAFCSADAIKVFDAGAQRLARYVLDPQHPDQTGFEVFQNGDMKFVNAGVKVLTMHS